MKVLIAALCCLVVAVAWREFDDWRDRRREARIQSWMNRVIAQGTKNLKDEYEADEAKCRRDRWRQENWDTRRNVRPAKRAS